LVKLLLSKGFAVTVLDNLKSGQRSNLKAILSDIEVVIGDIRDVPMLERTMRGMDYVFHQAAIPSIQESLQNPLEVLDVNVIGTLNVLSAASKASVKRVVLASSCSVYGESVGESTPEGYLKIPKSPYAASKLSGEAYAESYYYAHGLETICLRYFNVYGPGQKADSDYAAVIPKFLSAFQENRSPVIYGDGYQSRDFVYVNDVAQANLLAVQADFSHSDVDSGCHSINVGTGKSITILSLVEMLNHLTGREIQPVFQPTVTGGIYFSCADTSLAERLLNFKANTDISHAIQEMQAHYPVLVS
jgi:UDP-glucose 4-epimerase